MAEKQIEQEKKEDIKLTGKYIEAVGRRKSSYAIVRLYKKGAGNIFVNGKKLADYFPIDKAAVVKQPLKLSGVASDIDLSIKVNGGGSSGQAEAARHGITRVLIKMDENYKGALKAVGLVTRDSRDKERKKPGLKKARRAPQWSKR